MPVDDGGHAAVGVQLSQGSEWPWPVGCALQPGLALLEGEVALIGVKRSLEGHVLRRSTITSLKAPCLLPALPVLPEGVDIRLKVVEAARLMQVEEGTCSWHTDQPCPPAQFPDLLELLEKLIPPQPTPNSPQSIQQPLSTLVRWLAERHGTTPMSVAHPPADGLEHLRLLLNRADLLAVPLHLEARDLCRDCGDLIILTEAGPVLLLSEPSGYWWRDPASPERGLRRVRGANFCRDLPPWRALGISPSLNGREITPIALARFSYGRATHQTLVLSIAITVGLGIGFLFAIGKDVGAIRWIAGLGSVGFLLGAGMALLSDSLRPALIAALLSTLLGLLIPTFNTLLTNQALPDKDVNLMLQMAALLMAAALSDVGLRWSETRGILSVQQRGGHRLQFAALHRLLQLPSSFFRRYLAGELSLRFVSIAAVQEELQSLLSGGALQALLSAVFLLFMLRISLQLTILSVVVAFLLVLPTVWIGRRTLRLERRREEKVAEAGSRNFELISSVSKLRLAGVEEAAARYWWEPYRDSITWGYTVQVRSALASLLQTVVPNLGMLFLFIVITRLAADAVSEPIKSVPNVGELLGFFSAFTTFIGGVVSSASLMVQAFELPVLLDRAMPILQAKPESSDISRKDPGQLRGGVELDGLGFRYRPDGPWVIHAIHLSIQPGEFVAVVGASGSGKSTLVRLLLGLEEPQHGAIRFDGRPLERLRLDLVRRQIGVVPQNAALLSGTIHEVIAGGSTITIEDAWRAAEQAAIAKDIQSFPMGMYTIVSEGGGNLSGGQRQRLALARALARQPALLILDEATSALDNISQSEVSRQLQRLGLTRIVIAHRLSTIRDADRIVMLIAGQVVEQGTFEELIANDGPFAEMIRRQRSKDEEDKP